MVKFRALDLALWLIFWRNCKNTIWRSGFGALDLALKPKPENIRFPVVSSMVESIWINSNWIESNIMTLKFINFGCYKFKSYFILIFWPFLTIWTIMFGTPGRMLKQPGPWSYISRSSKIGLIGGHKNMFENMFIKIIN